MKFTFLKSKLKLQDRTLFENDFWHFRNYVFDNKSGSVCLCGGGGGAPEKFRKRLNSVKRHICNVKISRLEHALPTSKNDAE